MPIWPGRAKKTQVRLHFGFPGFEVSMPMSIVPNLRENMQPCVTLQMEDNWNSRLASPVPLLRQPLAEKEILT